MKLKAVQKGKEALWPDGAKASKPSLYLCFVLPVLPFRKFSLDRTPRGTGHVQDVIKRMALSFRIQCFTGEDPIVVLDFLSQIFAKPGTLCMSGGKADIPLPYMLRGLAEDQFKSERGY